MARRHGYGGNNQQEAEDGDCARCLCRRSNLIMAFFLFFHFDLYCFLFMIERRNFFSSKGTDPMFFFNLWNLLLNFFPWFWWRRKKNFPETSIIYYAYWCFSIFTAFLLVDGFTHRFIWKFNADCKEQCMTDALMESEIAWARCWYLELTLNSQWAMWPNHIPHFHLWNWFIRWDKIW